jgi:hypothetical protein
MEMSDRIRPGDDGLRNLSNGVKERSLLSALATMLAIASPGAMLLCGHQRHQLDVGLSSPNLIRTELAK